MGGFEPPRPKKVAWKPAKKAVIAKSREEQDMQSHSDEVRLRVLNALHWDFAVPRNRLRVEVENGRVTLSGIVDLPYQRTCAEFDVRNVPGVVGVVNQIRLASSETKSPSESRH
jgi:osmotically-inducible protein OsmY